MALSELPVCVLRHLASFLDLAALCALSRTARVGRCAAGDGLRGVSRACAELARRYPVVYARYMSRTLTDDDGGGGTRAPSVARMAALCSRWRAQAARSPCDALLAHMGRAFEVSLTPDAVPLCCHQELFPRRPTFRWWDMDLCDRGRRPARDAAVPERTCAWSDGGAAPVFRPGETVRVRVPDRAPHATTPWVSESDATFLLPYEPKVYLFQEEDGTLAVRIDLEAATDPPADRARGASLLFSVRAPPEVDADALRDERSPAHAAALRAYLEHARPRLGLEPHHAPAVDLDEDGIVWCGLGRSEHDAVLARMQRDGFPAVRLWMTDEFVP